MSGSMTCAPSDCGLTCTDPDSPVACPAHGSTAARCQSAGDRSATQYLPPVLRGGRVGRCPRRRLGGWKAMASPFTGTGRRGRSSLAVRANGWRPRGAPHRTTCWAAGSHGADHPLGRDRRATVRAARRRPSTASGGPRPTTSGPSATRASIIHWDGAAWSRVLSGTSYDLVDVWGADRRMSGRRVMRGPPPPASSSTGTAPTGRRSRRARPLAQRQLAARGRTTPGSSAAAPSYIGMGPHGALFPARPRGACKTSGPWAPRTP